MSDFEVTGTSGTVYLLNHGANAQCRIEALTGKTYPEVRLDLLAPYPSVRLIRTFVRGLLVKPVTDEEAGNILDDIGGWELIRESLAEGAKRQEAEKQAAIAAIEAEQEHALVDA